MPGTTTTSFLLTVMAILFAQSPGLRAENIHGTIVVKKRLTKRRVTASLPLYQRGVAVALSADTEAESRGDPLSFERARVVVYLEGMGASGGPASGVPGNEIQTRHDKSTLTSVPQVVATIEQLNRRFSQEVVVITAGSAVAFPNGDPIFHNVFSLSKAKTFDLGNFGKGETRVMSFPEPGIVYLNCRLHPNMAATIVVAPNRWNAKADGAGKFELRDVPPGKYTLTAWHKSVGLIRKSIEILPGHDASFDLLMPLDDDAPDAGRPASSRNSGTR